MRSMVLIVVAALVLSIGVVAQSVQTTLPKCMQDAAPINVDFKDVTVVRVLTFLGTSCGIEIRAEGIEGTDAAFSIKEIVGCNALKLGLSFPV